MQRTPGPGPRGVMSFRKGEIEHGHHARHLPAEPLRSLIDFYWGVRWDLRGRAPGEAETLPHPCVYWVIERGEADIHGIATKRFTRTLEGRGRAFGVRFRPGGFRPWLGSAVSALQDRSVTAESVFGKEGGALAAELVRLDRWALEEDGRDSAADEQMMDLLDRFLLARVPNPDPRAELAITIAGAIATDQSLLRVEQVAARYGLTVRGLQRLFSEYVGTTPKWVIKRYRMHEAIERLQEGSPEAWTRFALELGYFDQAHFIREFRAITGRSPGKYAATKG